MAVVEFFSKTPPSSVVHDRDQKVLVSPPHQKFREKTVLVQRWNHVSLFYCVFYLSMLQVTFNVTVNTMPVDETAVSVLREDTAGVEDKTINQTKVTSEEEVFFFQDVAQEIR